MSWVTSYTDIPWILYHKEDPGASNPFQCWSSTYGATQSSEGVEGKGSNHLRECALSSAGCAAPPADLPGTSLAGITEQLRCGSLALWGYNG